MNYLLLQRYKRYLFCQIIPSKIASSGACREGGGIPSLRSGIPSVREQSEFRCNRGLLCILRHALTKASFRRARRQIQMPHSRAAPDSDCIARRKRDSNPRNVAVQQFSRLPPSTTRPFLRTAIAKIQKYRKDGENTRLFCRMRPGRRRATSAAGLTAGPSLR